MASRARSVSHSAAGLAALAAPSVALAGDVELQATPAVRNVSQRARLTLERAFPAASQADLRERDRLDLPSGAVTRYDQWHLRHRVVGGGAAVREGKTQGKSLVHASLVRDFSTVHIAPIDATMARAKARAPQGAKAELVWWSLRGERALTWELTSPLTFEDGKPTAYRTLVDAESGEVRYRENRVRFMDQASVYPQNPITTKTTALLPLALPSTNGILQNDFIKAYNCVDKKAKRPVSFGGFTLDLHVCDVAPTAAADANGDFIYTPVDDKSEASKADPFAEVSIYFHTARAYDFFRGLDGRPDAQVAASKPLSAVANLQVPAGVQTGDFSRAGDVNIPLEPFSNAFFSPGGADDPFASVFGLGLGTMWFGQGPERDYSYDADVVYHEFTHAVVDNTLRLGSYTLDDQGLSAAPGGMNEGLADFFSSAITGDPDVGEYAAKDLSQNSGVIRTLANTDTCPTGIVGEVHGDSTLFSGALWAARSTLPEASRKDFDKSIYESMVANSGEGDIGYTDLAKLFIKGLQLDLPAGATALTAAMTTRSVLPKCARVINYDGRPIGDALQYFAVGRQSVNLALVPGVMSFGRTLSEKTSRKLQVKYTGRSIGGTQQGSTPFQPVVMLKYDGAVTWKYTGKNATPSADAQQTGEAAGATLTFDIPNEVKSVQVQIANSGTNDGVYGQVELVEVLPAAPKPVDKDPIATPIAGGAGGTIEGGGCATGGAGTHVGAGGLASLAALALVLAGRRRKAS